MASQIPRRLLSRLVNDLAELRDTPYPGVAVFTDDADLRKLCLVLTPPSGPWKDLSLHFDVSLSKDWPAEPPHVSNSVHGIEHPNLFGNYICCDLLKTRVYAERGYSGGYTPALTLRGLFLQFLTFFSSTSVEQDYGGRIHLGEHIDVQYFLQSNSPTQPQETNAPQLEYLWTSSTSPEILVADPSSSVYLHKFKVVDGNQEAVQLHRVEYLNPRWKSTLVRLWSFRCPKCPYGSPLLPHHNRSPTSNEPTNTVPMSLFHPPANCALDNLTEDCLYELSHRMSSESLISFCRSYPRFRAVMDSYHVLLRRELNCFFLRVPLSECVLGIGIAFDRKARSLSSDFDWLSMEAFDNHRIRVSIEKRDFDYFLPLAFSPGNFQRVTPEIWRRLSVIDRELCMAEAEIERRTRRPANRRTRPVTSARPYDAVEVLYRMMNSIVVSLMKSCDDNMDKLQGIKTLLFASEKAVTSYCLLLHLLMCLCRSQPEILSNATTKLRQFIQDPMARLKQTTPDLGELIITITLVLMMDPVDKASPITWELILLEIE